MRRSMAAIMRGALCALTALVLHASLSQVHAQSFPVSVTPATGLLQPATVTLTWTVSHDPGFPTQPYNSAHVVICDGPLPSTLLTGCAWTNNLYNAPLPNTGVAVVSLAPVKTCNKPFHILISQKYASGSPAILSSSGWSQELRIKCPSRLIDKNVGDVREGPGGASPPPVDPTRPVRPGGHEGTLKPPIGPTLPADMLPAYIEIKKTVVDNTGGTVLPSNLVSPGWPIWLSCSNALNIWLPVPLPGGSSSTNDPTRVGYSNTQASPHGTICTVLENQGSPSAAIRPITSIPSRICPNKKATVTTTYVPSASVTLTGGKTETIEVVNTLDCEKEHGGDIKPGSLLISKTYTHPTSPTINTYADGATFTVTAVCTNPANPSQTGTVSGTIVSAHTNTNFTTLNVPIGWSCVVTEIRPTGVDSNGCTWQPEAYVSPNPVTILAPPAINAVGIKNNYVCPGNASLDLDITKAPMPTAWPPNPAGAFWLTVQNVGSSTMAVNGLTVTDTLTPTTSSITSFGSTSAAWTCGPTGGNTASCTYSGGPLAPFASLPPIEIRATIAPGPSKQNCAKLSISGDTVASNNQYCMSW